MVGKKGITKRYLKNHGKMSSTSSREATDMRGSGECSSECIGDNPRLTRGVIRGRKSEDCLEAKYTLQEHMHEQERK